MDFQENLAALAEAGHLSRIEVTGPDGGVAVIENRPGSQGSLRVYQHLALKFGRIDASAAAEGLELFAEHTEDALRHPGKHPNIDRLLDVQARGVSLSVRLVEATA